MANDETQFEDEAQPAKEPTEEEKLFARVDALKERTRVSQNLPDVPNWEYERPKTGPGSKAPIPTDAGNAKSLGLGISVAYMMAGSVIISFGLGWLIDKAAHTGTVWETFLGLGGTILGITGTVLMIQKAGQS